MIRTAIITTLIASGLAAQDHIFLTGHASTGGPLGTTINSYPAGRHKDQDRDGLIGELTEVYPFLTKSFVVGTGKETYMAALGYTKEGDAIAFYFADSSQGHITRGVDADHDGTLEDHEVTEFAAMNTGYAPEGLAVFRDVAKGQTIVYVANDDQRNSPGIHRFIDLNGDGDAKDPGESSIFVDASLGLSVTGKAGPVQLANDWWFSLHVTATGKVLAYNAGPYKKSGGGGGAQTPDMFCWYEFTDNAGVASAKVFFNPSQNNGMATHTDFDTGGSFPQWDVKQDTITSPNNHPLWANIAYLTEERNTPLGTPPTYYFGSSYRDSTTISGYNPANVLVAGLVYKWTDLDGSESIDPNEITLFANITNAVVAGVQPFSYTSGTGTAISTLTDQTFGIAATNGKLHLCWDSKNKVILTLDDTNQSGVIETGECSEVYLWTGGQGAVPTYNAQFGPFVKGFASLPEALLPGPFDSAMVPYGQGCPNPLTLMSPVIDVFGGQSTIGNTSFELSVSRVPANSPNFLIMGLQQQSLSLAPILPGCTLLSDAMASTGPSVANQAGIASANIAIPNDPNLVGNKVYFQWATLLGGVSLSNGLEVTFK